MIAVLASHLFAASSDSGPVWLLILGPAAGGACTTACGSTTATRASRTASSARRA
jgi:hypothetical protein